MPATFYGIGVGPGDPELITHKAARLLAEVDWIFYPSTAGASGLAREIVAGLGLPEQKFRRVEVEMSRQRSAASVDYRRAAEEIAAELQAGRSVAWITEGDPLFYSTFVHVLGEVKLAAPQAVVEIVPGVTSMQAAAARAQLPLAHLAERIAILPAAYGVGSLPALVDEFATVVLLKVHSVWDQLLDTLADLNDDVQVMYLERVGTPRERIVTELESLRGQEVPYFSLVIVRRGVAAAMPTAATPAAEQVIS
jgi:precorrin-2/cobalt-factor-2 C20-methyltransferase